MNWFQMYKTRKRRKRKLQSNQDSITLPVHHGKTSGWAELTRQDALSFWIKSHGVK